MLALALSYGGRALGAVLDFLGRIPPIAWLVMGLACWGWWGHHLQQATAAKAQAQALAAADAATAASEKARKAEQLANTLNQQVTNELIETRTQRDAAARTAADRLRKLADAPKSTPAHTATAASCRGYEGPAVDVIPGAVRERLGELFDEADQVADRLTACQAYVHSVVRP